MGEVGLFLMCYNLVESNRYVLRLVLCLSRGGTCLWTEPQDQLSEGTPVHLLALRGFVLGGVGVTLV